MLRRWVFQVWGFRFGVSGFRFGVSGLGLRGGLSAWDLMFDIGKFRV